MKIILVAVTVLVLSACVPSTGTKHEKRASIQLNEPEPVRIDHMYERGQSFRETNYSGESL